MKIIQELAEIKRLRALMEEDISPEEGPEEEEESDTEATEPVEEDYSWIAPLARIAANAIVGSDLPLPTKKNKKQKPQSPEGYLVPVIEDYRRMSGFNLQEECDDPTLEDCDTASILAVVAEMVGIDLSDLLMLEDEEFERVADTVAPNIDDTDQVQRAAHAAKHHSAQDVLRSIENPETRRLLYDRLEKIMERRDHWIQKAIKKPGALHKQMKTPKAKKIPKKRLSKAALKGGKLGRRARLALTLKKFKRH